MASANPDGSEVTAFPLGVLKDVMRISRLFLSSTREGIFNSFTRGFSGGMSSSAPYLQMSAQTSNLLPSDLPQ